jgi:hypothetical protein
MPTFNITAPDGTQYRVTAPEGATEQDALAKVQEQHAAAENDKGFFQRLSEGQYPTLYNPKSKLFPGPTGKPPQMRGLDLPTFAEGMGEAPGVTLAGAAAPLAATLPAEGASVIGGGAARAFGALPDWAKKGIVTGTLGMSAVTAEQLGAPKAVIDWIKNFELAASFPKH